MPGFCFDPDRPLAPDIVIVQDALLVPFDDRSPGRRAALGGVLAADGGFVEASLVRYSADRIVNRAPHPASGAEASDRPGTWLFGGKHDNRFGHVLVESMARLWALDAGIGPVDGILFLPKKILPEGRARKQARQTAPLFDLIADLPPWEVATRPLRVARLIVPPQGCGAEGMAPGCPEFRAFMRARFAPQTPPRNRGARLYISRTGMLATPGHILFEAAIEDIMRAEGYEVYHPQDHDLRDQIARYRGAETILGVEGSAFHMVALANPPAARIGVIRRRQGGQSAGFADQVSKMTGRPCADLDAVEDSFTIPGAHALSNGILNFASLLAGLRAAGFVTRDHALPPQTPAAIEAEKARLILRMTGPT